MASTNLLLCPEAGARLRVCGQGFDDAGTPYVFKVKPKPKGATVGGYVSQSQGDLWATWELLGLQVFHVGAVDLIATPIVDDVEYPLLEFPLQIASPGRWKRSTVEGRFSLFGRKCTFRLRTHTITALFHLMGAYVDARPEPGFRPT